MNREDRLSAPVPTNDPRLLRLVRVRALSGFALGHNTTAAPGDLVMLPWHVARDLCFMKKAAWVHDEDAQR